MSKIALIAALSLVCVWGAQAQMSAAPDRATIRRQVTDLMQYLELQPTEIQLTAMVDGIEASQKPNATVDQRADGLAQLLTAYYEVVGLPAAPQLAALRRAAATMASGARFTLGVPRTPVGAAPGDVAVETRGHGPVQMVLLGDVGLDAIETYGDFARRNADRYTMHIISLPGFGRAPLPHWPEVRDFSRRPWLKAASAAIARKIQEGGWKDFILIGTGAGGYFAARLALEQPERTHGMILVNALVRSPLASLRSPGEWPELEERQRIPNIRAFPEQLVPRTDLPPADAVEKILRDPNNHDLLLRDLWTYAVRDADTSIRWSVQTLTGSGFEVAYRYGSELQTTDLSEDLKRLRVRTLALCSNHDVLSPAVRQPPAAQWLGMKLLAPDIPLSIATLEDTRAHISVDRPVEFDLALRDFIAGRDVKSQAKRLPVRRPSPRAEVMQVVGATEIRITYGRPAVKEREIWGKLVPHDRVWRAGADEATTISFTTNVKIEGEELSAGTYTFFTIPGVEEWTLIFNKVPVQWGAFNYDKQFDALRVKVQPEPAEMQESLAYSFGDLRDKMAKVILQWEKLRVAFHVEGAK